MYCDESYPELLSSQSEHATYVVIGGLWVSSTVRAEIKAPLSAMLKRGGIKSEFKWSKVRHKDQEFYRELIDLFFSSEALSFRCIVIDSRQVDFAKYHQGDRELSFYKFYYHLLAPWLSPNNEYVIFCDFKQNKVPNRLQTLEECLRHGRAAAVIRKVEAADSSKSLQIQMSDVLTGALSATVNNRLKVGSAKSNLVEYLETKLGRSLGPTSAKERKFNVFGIRLE